MKISEHLTLERACHSETAIRLGINNFPMNPNFVDAMKLVAEKVFEPCLKSCPTASISSFYRCDKLNAAIGGASKNGVQTSQHCKGEAIDIITKGWNAELFHWVKSNLVFDQLIWEFGDTNSPAWVHVSYVEGRPNRKQVLRAYRDKNGTHYMPFDL